MMICTAGTQWHSWCGHEASRYSLWEQTKETCSSTTTELHGNYCSRCCLYWFIVASYIVKHTHCRFIKKCKGRLRPKVSLGGVLISLTWHMASVSPDLRSPSQPQSVTTLWPVPSYTAWWQRHTGVSSLPKATVQWCRGRTRTATYKSQVRRPTNSVTYVLCLCVVKFQSLFMSTSTVVLWVSLTLKTLGVCNCNPVCY